MGHAQGFQQADAGGMVVAAKIENARYDLAGQRALFGQLLRAFARVPTDGARLAPLPLRSRRSARGRPET